MRLVDLNPRWIIDTGARAAGVIVWDPTRHGMGVSFRCPHLGCKHRIGVMFANPLDGGVPSLTERLWERTGDTFETLTIVGAVDASEAAHWTGFVINGEIA